MFSYYKRNSYQYITKFSYSDWNSYRYSIHLRVLHWNYPINETGLDTIDNNIIYILLLSFLIPTEILINTLFIFSIIIITNFPILTEILNDILFILTH